MWVCWEEDKALCERASYQIDFVGVNCPWRCLLCPVHQSLTMSNTLLATVKDSRHCSIDLSCIALCFSELFIVDVGFMWNGENHLPGFACMMA